LPAANSGTLLVMAFGGTDPATGRPFVASELAAGGMGARPRKDGIDVVETDVSNCMNIPVESVEMSFPLRVRRAGLWQDSGGAARGAPPSSRADRLDVRSRRGRAGVKVGWTTAGAAGGLNSASSVVAPTGPDRTYTIQVRDFIAR